MAERIYILDGNNLEPMEEQGFASEDKFQDLLARHLDLLDGEMVSPGNPRRWLLVKREMGVSVAAGESDRWWLDHLLVDQDARPTLVEVKRSTDTRIRREVVGQMLDYAANAAQFWTLETLRHSFRETWKDEADEALRDLLQPDGEEADEETFWSQVATNLAAKNLRLLFVADAIPIELARIVEFLNAQFRDNIEVLAVEVKQFKGSSEGRSTLVPNVIGHTAAPVSKGGAGGARIRSKISLDEFMSLLPSAAVRDATQQLFDVAQDCGAKIELGDKGVTIRVKAPDYHYMVTVAWLYPPDVMGWKGLKNYAFGESVSDDAGFPEKRKEALRAWVGHFEGESDAFGERHHRYDTVRARIITHQEAATRVDTLAERLAQVIRDLQAS